MLYRLRTLLIVALVAPPLLAGLLLYGERTWNEVRRSWIRRQATPDRGKIVRPSATPAPPSPSAP